MDCLLCDSDLAGWRQVHRHLVDAHGDAIELLPPHDDAPPVFRVGCPRCAWTFEQRLRGQRRDAAFIVEHRSEIALVAFDQLMVHWAEEHMSDTDEAATTGGDDGDGERM